MKGKVALLALVGVVAFAASAQAFFDDFESYADTAAMLAPGAWGDLGASAAGTSLLDTFGNPGQSMWHPGGAVARHQIAPTNPSDSNPIVFEFDIYHDGTGNKRVGGGLRDDADGSLASIIEMAVYNDLASFEDPLVKVSGFGIRTVFIGGVPANWVAFPGTSYVVAEGWHHMKATIGATSIKFELDKGDDGTVDGTIIVTTNDTSGIAYDNLRLGGPSNLSSAGGGAAFDNVNFEVVPEPATLALLGLGGLFLRRRRA